MDRDAASKYAYAADGDRHLTQFGAPDPPESRELRLSERASLLAVLLLSLGLWAAIWATLAALMARAQG